MITNWTKLIREETANWQPVVMSHDLWVSCGAELGLVLFQSSVLVADISEGTDSVQDAGEMSSWLEMGYKTEVLHLQKELKRFTVEEP